MKFVRNMQIDLTNYKMSYSVYGSIYTSIFAIFIMDLFNKVENWSGKEVDSWVDYITSYQDKKTGCFIPTNYNGELESKPVFQLTAFCLSALGILKSKPKYKLEFLRKYSQKKLLKEYLIRHGCDKGYGKSGNMAMFIAIFFTFQYELSGKNIYKHLITNWFDLHDSWQNPNTGFWGKFENSDPYLGFQNGFHQFVIYNYWDRPINYSKAIIDRVLKLQDINGHFAHVPGGGGCYDYDAVDILINIGLKNKYREADIYRSLNLIKKTILASQNTDGGFSESNLIPKSYLHLCSKNYLMYLTYPPEAHIVKSKLINTLKAIRNKRVVTHWTISHRTWSESDMWDTWFRSLSLAIINVQLNNKNLINNTAYKFHTSIGLGYFKQNE